MDKAKKVIEKVKRPKLFTSRSNSQPTRSGKEVELYKEKKGRKELLANLSAQCGDFSRQKPQFLKHFNVIGFDVD